MVAPLDDSLHTALQNRDRGDRAGDQRRGRALWRDGRARGRPPGALNVVFEVEGGRSFLRRKLTDVASTFVLMALMLVTLIMVFVGGRFAEDLLGFIGFGSTAAEIWSIVRWPGALAVAMLVFALVYFRHARRAATLVSLGHAGAAAGVLLWLIASLGLSIYISNIADVGAAFGTFAARSCSRDGCG